MGRVLEYAEDLRKMETNAGEALRDVEEKYREILESIEDGYYEVDIKGNLSFFNESLCRMVGYSRQELMGMNNRQYMTPETAKKVYETFNAVYRTGRPTKVVDWDLLRKDGQVRYIEASVSPLYGPMQRIVGFRGIARDVTERQKAEAALRESEEKYREIIESIEDGYYEVDIKGNMVFFNEQMSRMVGYSHEELTGMNNRQYMTPETAKKVYETFNAVYRTGRPTRVLDWDLVRKDGQVRYIEVSVSPVFGPKRKIIGFRGIARDVTEVKSLEKARERVINHLSHEIRTPVTIIDAVLARVSREIQKFCMADLEKTIRRAMGGVERLREIQDRVEDILNLKPVEERQRLVHVMENVLCTLEGVRESGILEGTAATVLETALKRLESLFEKKEGYFKEIHVEPFLSRLCEEVVPFVKSRDLEIVKGFSGEIYLNMDTGILDKVCRGMLKNAIENTPDGGKIEISAESGDYGTRILFRDYGIGISPQNQRMIFEGFFHTVDTSLYASRKPYQFNAGGTGADLLRTRIFSERYGFGIALKSDRCRFIPSDHDLCSGKILSCPFIKSRDDCLASGGSTFSITFQHG